MTLEEVDALPAPTGPLTPHGPDFSARLKQLLRGWPQRETRRIQFEGDEGLHCGGEWGSDFAEHDDDGWSVTVLAELPEKALLDELALSKALGVCRRTIRNMAERNELPPGVRFGGRPMWMAGRILAHFEARADEAARDAERVAKRLGSFL